MAIYSTVFEELNSLYESDNSGFADVDALVNELLAGLNEGTEAGEEPLPSVGVPYYISRLYHDYVDASEMRWREIEKGPKMSDRTVKILDYNYRRISDPEHAKRFCIMLGYDEKRRAKLRGNKKAAISPEDITDMLIGLICKFDLR